MGTGCFDNAGKERDTAKRHKFTGRIPLAKHEKFGPVVPAPKPLNATEPVREPTLMRTENLQALIESLKDSIENPPSVTIPESEACGEEETIEDVEQVSNKRPRTEPDLDTHQEGPSGDPKPTLQTDPEITTATDTSIPDFFDFEMPDTTVRSHPESTSKFQFDVGISSGATVSEHDEAAMRIAANKMKFLSKTTTMKIWM
ncbi:hypothetical protein Hanom_Chr11g01052451 [Helianthus anomalus]